MTLTEAIRSLVEAKGLNILTSPMALNILSDYNAFNDFPSSRNILKNIISEGYLEKIAFFYDNQLPMGDAPQTYLSELYTKLGFRQDVSAYVLNSILEALGYNTGLTIANNEDVMFSRNSKLPQDDSDMELTEVNDGNHFEFKGICINGPASKVANKLIQVGYQEVDRGDGGVLLNGKFAGKDNCQILVTASPYTGQTYSIAIFTPASLNWWGVKADYDNMKIMLQKKYGKPSSRTEFFSQPYEEGDGYELTALSSGNAFFVTRYSTDKGEVSICITNNAQLLISYIDKINNDEHNAAESLSAQEDI